MNLKIVTVVGARPQFIKAAAVSREIAKRTEIREIIVHTGQHFDRNMSDVFFEEMEIPSPDYRLDINSLNHGAMTGRMLEKVEEVLLKEKPDFVMVYGDTNTTLAGALAASKLHIGVVHVEAGMRSFNMRMPEEVNRILTDRISDILCCPTENAVRNLHNEGFDGRSSTIVMCGDVMQDSVLHYRKKAVSRRTIVEKLGLSGGKYALCTVHRAENTDDPRRLGGILGALNDLSGELEIVLPLHPRTEKSIRKNPVGMKFAPIEPVGYMDMLALLDGAEIVVTDSGGLQKEACFFKKPCVTLRDETEWTELVERGFNVLAGADRGTIVGCCRDMLGKRIAYDDGMYGGGRASGTIVRAILGIPDDAKSA